MEERVRVRGVPLPASSAGRPDGRSAAPASEAPRRRTAIYEAAGRARSRPASRAKNGTGVNVAASAAQNTSPASTESGVHGSRAASDQTTPTNSAVYSAPIVAAATPIRRTAAAYVVCATSVEPTTISPKNHQTVAGASRTCMAAAGPVSARPGIATDAIEIAPTRHISSADDIPRSEERNRHA